MPVCLLRRICHSSKEPAIQFAATCYNKCPRRHLHCCCGCCCCFCHLFCSVLLCSHHQEQFQQQQRRQQHCLGSRRLSLSSSVVVKFFPTFASYSSCCRFFFSCCCCNSSAQTQAYGACVALLHFLRITSLCHYFYSTFLAALHHYSNANFKSSFDREKTELAR